MRHDHWIDGKEAPPALGHYLPTVDPRTRESTDEVAAGTLVDVDDAVAAAARAQPLWAACSAAERSGVLHAVADVMAAATDELMELEGRATGKLASDLRVEIDMSASYFRYYAGVVRAHGGRTIDQGSGTHTFTRLEPFGVVGIITPWNVPLLQAARGIAPALAVGNAVVAKPSEFTSLSTLSLARLATDAGLLGGLLNVVTGTGPDAGTPLASHRSVRRVMFTGSVDTGRHLAALAAERIVPMTLELGGKSPLIVFADADLDRAASAAVATLAYNAGQVCSATTRVLVEESVHDEVVAQIVELAAQLRPGADFGPMITQSQYEKVLSHFAGAHSSGLVPALGGTGFEDGPGARGWYVRPTVYANVPSDALIAREEIFGPVLVTMPFSDESDALTLANDTDYGLVASIWSGDLARGLRLAEQVDAGQVAINGGALTIETPFGGFKQSGYGREKGVEALHDYAQIKTISMSLH
jgi:acyl-CoA reductase-like NAD-dependent aldehyde dehydrogenase